MTSQEIHVALKKMFLGGFVYIQEFRAGTGYSDASNRYLDAWVMQIYPSKPMTALAIEIKVSRADFCAEIKRPLKRDSALRISNQFYFAAPVGIIRDCELPEECGLIEVDLVGTARIICDAPHREFIPNLPFVASLARRVPAIEELRKAIL